MNVMPPEFHDWHKDSRHSKSRHSRKKPRSKRILMFSWLIPIGLIVAGCYLLALVFAPTLSIFPASDKGLSIDMPAHDSNTDTRNRIQIPKIALEVAFHEGGADQLENGAWHRYPERGNPEMGGNFILSAHRFKIGLTPSQTKYNSPFYNIGLVSVGDPIRIFYDGRWYDYEVTKKFAVKPNDTYIEAPSSEAKMTLYSCTLGGSNDGRDVIEAKLKS